MRLRFGNLFTLAVLLAGPVAFAAPSETDRANALFDEGRALLERGDTAKACDKLQQSFQLAPRLGAMINLGACYETLGKLARALAIYERAATMAHEAGRPDRERAARELSSALERRVAKLLLVIEERPSGLSLELDDEALPQGDLIAIDPGAHRLTARAPGRDPWTTEFTAEAGKPVRLAVPRLLPEAAAPKEPPAPPAPERPNRLRTIGVASGLAVAAIGIGVGSVFGLRAMSKHDDSDAECDARGCTRAGLSLIDEAKTAGTISTAGFVGAGLGLAAAGAFALFLPATTARVSIGPSTAGLRFSF